VAAAVLVIQEIVHSRGSERFRRRWASWVQTVIASVGTATIKISTPASRMFCGMSVSAELARTSSRMASVSAARVGRILPPLTIRSRLMETETNSRPVSVVAAAAIAVKNGSQSATS
jgi:hypothetical protein